MNRMTESSVVGTNILVRSGDPAKCLVMLHGIGSNAHTFDRLCTHLPPDWTLVSWNAPGYGGSASLSKDRPVAADYADRLADVTLALGLQHFSIIGHSLGTLIAAEFAAVHPDRTDQVILMSCAQGYGMQEGADLPEKAAARLRSLAELGPRAFAQARAPKLMHDPGGQPEIRRAAIEAMASIDPGGYAQAVYMLAAGNLAARVPHIMAPCLVMVGSQDVITPPEQSRRTFDVMRASDNGPACSYREIADAGHIVHQERPEPVAEEIRSFLCFKEPSLQEARN